MSLTSNHEARTIEGYRSVTRAIADEATFAKTQLDKLNVKAVDDSYNRLGGRHLPPNAGSWTLPTTSATSIGIQQPFWRAPSYRSPPRRLLANFAICPIIPR